MEQRERTILEIVAAVIFVALLILGSIIVINASQGYDSDVRITNSYNTYNYNIYPGTERGYVSTARPSIAYYRDDGSVYRVNNKRYLRYDHDSQFRVADGLFGNDINRYEVYVRNREYVGGNFKVIFYFEDYNGDTDSYAMTHYIQAREEKLFLLKDVTPSRYKYRDWWYEIKSLDKTNSFY